VTGPVVSTCVRSASALTLMALCGWNDRYQRESLMKAPPAKPLPSLRCEHLAAVGPPDVLQDEP
jgi:hypothetical protein